MVPNARFDKPGKSPFMDMQLVPVYADEVGPDAGVSVSASVTQSLGIRMGKVEKVSIQPKLQAVGAVAFNDQLLEVVAARAEGVVTRLYVHAPFEPVRRDQTLAEVTSPTWLEAQQEYLSLLDAQSEAGRGLRSAARERLRVIGVPEAAIQQIESKHSISGSTVLVAPIDGVISELSVREGTAISPGMPLFRINGLESVWVNARIPEAQRALAVVGSQVEASAVAWPGVKFKGKLIAIQPQVEMDSRTITARVLLENADRKLAPGMFVSADIVAAAQGPQLVVPDEAVIATGQRNVVITADAKGMFGVAHVMTGASQDGRTVIMEGLKEGQAIVLSGQFLIDSEASLKSTVARLETPQAAQQTSEASADNTQPDAHLAEGSIMSITAGVITIEHGPIPSLQWPGMTMGFRAPANGLPKSLKVGDRVSFSFVEAQGVYRITGITKLDEHAGMAEHGP
jgi:Cu(I)/Ag(I) efflux system membrane fusion protein